MSHTFLMEEGRWKLEGSWLERNGMPIPVKGKTIIAWTQDNWFTMATKLVFPSSNHEQISFQYRGRLAKGERQYNYVLQQSILGRIEGEGWISPQSIVQRYWVLEDRQRRSGFETLYRINDNTYHLCSGIMAGHYLNSTMDAIIKRQT